MQLRLVLQTKLAIIDELRSKYKSGKVLKAHAPVLRQKVLHPLTKKNTTAVILLKKKNRKKHRTQGTIGESGAKKQKTDLSMALCFIMCETIHKLSSKLWKLIENIYISMTVGRSSISSGCVMLAGKWAC